MEFRTFKSAPAIAAKPLGVILNNQQLRRDKMYEDIEFSSDFSVEDWNALVTLKLKKYFTNENIFESNKEILRTEIINFIRFSKKPEYFSLFEWIFNLHKECLSKDKVHAIKIISDSFNEVSDTDMKWMTNVLTQSDISTFSERDKISYLFKCIDETIEGVFKPRFKLFDKIAYFSLNQSEIDNSNFDFGKIIRDFPIQYKNEVLLLLQDPVFSISTNQWRNIASHKSFVINKEDIDIEYGKISIQRLTISYEQFYKIFYWSQDIYRVLRLAQVLIDLNHIEEIVTELGGTENLDVRFESSLLHIIQNMQIVGFEFASTEDDTNTFCLNVKGKHNHDVKSSLIHASQCLDQLSCAIYDDKFVRDNFQNTQISIVNENHEKLGSAKIPIEIALKKVKSEIDLAEYLDNMKFEIKNYA